jgi:Ca2+-binding EF-hand superfamily protein
MFSKRKIAPFASPLVLVCIALAQKEPAPKAQDKVAIGEAEVTQLLLLMDTDKSGKVSKAEFMKFMEAEFTRLDKDRSGELDPKELLQMQRPVRPAVGK